MKQLKTCNHQWLFARDNNKNGYLICNICGKEDWGEHEKYLYNPLDENSTLNMDNGSGNLTNKKNKSGGSFRNKGNNILPPTTKVRLNAAGRQVMSANVAGGGGAYFPYGDECKHIEGEMEEYDNLGMYHIASGVCKKCGMSMVDWDKNNKDNGGRKHSGKATPKVHLSKREEFEDFLVSLSYKYNDERTLAMDDIYEYHITEMKELLESVEKEIIGIAVSLDKIADEEAKGKLSYNHCTCLKSCIYKQNKKLEKLKEELK